MIEPVIAYVHFLSAFLVTAFLITEFVLCRPSPSRAQVETLARVDVYYLIAAVAVLISGVLRVFGGGKGAAFYFEQSGVLHQGGLVSCGRAGVYPANAAVHTLAARVENGRQTHSAEQRHRVGQALYCVRVGAARFHSTRRRADGTGDRLSALSRVRRNSFFRPNS